MNDLEIGNNIFENIKHIDEEGCEYWYARELMNVLKYKRWDKFNNVIGNAKTSCKQSNNDIEYHFSQVGKMIIIAKNGKRKIIDYKLSRYACYLIVQNADLRKEVVALGQTYFAVLTRKMELTQENYKNSKEEEKRFYQRNLTKKGNYSLNIAAKHVGVKNFDKFHNSGYKGLYNGKTANDIVKRKGLRYREDILDNMCSEKLADNLFHIDGTEAKLKNDNIVGENNANKTHYEVGSKIRNTIKELGGTMPEDLPTLSKSLKKLDKVNKLVNK